MATYSYIEDMRDWLLDNLAEMRAKMTSLNGAENQVIVERIGALAEQVSVAVLDMARCLDEMLVEKKEAEYEE